MRTAIVATALSLVAWSIGLAGSATRPKTHTITIEGMQFRPQELTVASGDIIEWVNKGLVAHTATSVTAGIFDSKLIEPDKSWKLTIRTKGDLSYICTYHPTMTGSLRVE